MVAFGLAAPVVGVGCVMVRGGANIQPSRPANNYVFDTGFYTN